MFSLADSSRPAARLRRPLSALALAAIAFAASSLAAPREAHALFEQEAYVAGWDAYEQSLTAWYYDGNSVENSYHHYLAAYSYYGFYYVAYGYWYADDDLIDQARVYFEGAEQIADALLYYEMGYYDTYLARENAKTAKNLCFWAWLF